MRNAKPTQARLTPKILEVGESHPSAKRRRDGWGGERGGERDSLGLTDIYHIMPNVRNPKTRPP